MVEDSALARYQDISAVQESACCFTRSHSRSLCCRCAHKRKASPLTCLAICFLVLTYNLLGAFLFLALEGSVEETAVAASKPNLSNSYSSTTDLRSKTVERLWSITEDLNILYKENWTKLAAKELMDFQKVMVKSIRGGVGEVMTFDSSVSYRWTFSSSFLYALTLITTIGHGNVTPQSTAGKMVAIAYACVGIPVVMLYLATVGDAMARRFRGLYSRICPTSGRDLHARADCLVPQPVDRQTPFQTALNLGTLNNGYHWTCRDHTRVPILLSFTVIVLYVAVGTFVFHATEKWNFLEGCYFSFSSLATIGFGDLKPGLHASTVSAKHEDIALGVCCVYILVGIVVIAMCFNLIQEDMSVALRGMTSICADRSKTHAVHTTAAPVVVEKVEEKLTKMS